MKKIVLSFALLLLATSFLLFGCTTKEVILQPQDNTWYGEDWNKADGGFETIDLVTPGVYVPVKRLGAGNLNGFSVVDGNLIAAYSGLYYVTVTSSVEGVTASGEYGMKVFVNESGKNNCYAHSHLSTNTESMGINCLVRLVAGDKVNVRFDDHANPVRDLIVSSFNFSLLKVGN